MNEYGRLLEGAMETDYLITFSGEAIDGRMSGNYQIATPTRQTSQYCRFGPGCQEQAAYLTLITGLGDLITRIQRAGASPGDFSVTLCGDMPEPIDGRVKKSRDWALGLLRQFREWVEVGETAVVLDI